MHLLSRKCFPIRIRNSSSNAPNDGWAMSDDDKTFLPFVGVAGTLVGVVVAVVGIYAAVCPHFTVELKRIAHSENKASVFEWDELTVNNQGLVPVTLRGVRVGLAYNSGVDREEIVPISGTVVLRGGSPPPSETKEGRYPSIGTISKKLWDSILRGRN
jgi:hypothetical protein